MAVLLPFCRHDHDRQSGGAGQPALRIEDLCFPDMQGGSDFYRTGDAAYRAGSYSAHMVGINLDAHDIFVFPHHNQPACQRQ